MVAITVLAPNAVQIIELLPSKNAKKTSYSYTYRRLLQELKRQKLVEFHDNPRKGMSVMLTLKGVQRLHRSELDKLEIDTTKKWDGVWRTLIFDIPRTQQRDRFSLLKQLRRLGFYQLKQSVWVHPYPCDSIIDRVVTHFNLREYCLLSDSHFSKEVDATLRQRFRHLL